MKKEYWEVSDEQVVEKTGYPVAHWMQILDAFEAIGKRSNDVVTYLQTDHNVPRYWARTLTTLHAKKAEANP